MKTRILLLALLTTVLLSSFTGEKSAEKTINSAISNTSVNGCIIDEISGETLVGVEIVLEGTNQKTYTDFNGNFEFNNVAIGKYEISAKLVSYRDVHKKDIQVKADNTNHLKINMGQIN